MDPIDQTQSVLVNEYDEAKLPPSFRALLAPETPLPNQTIFFPRHRTWANVAITLAGSVVAVMAGLVVVLLALAAGAAVDANQQRGGSFVGVAAVGLVGVLGGLLWGWSVRTKVRAIRAQQAGRPLRYGVFLAPEGMLDRREVGYTMVPRQRIREIKLDESGAARIVFASDQLGERGLSISNDLGEATPATLVEVMHRWLLTTDSARSAHE